VLDRDFGGSACRPCLSLSPLPEPVEGNGFDGFDKLSRRSSAAEAQPPKLSRRKLDSL